MVAILYDTTLKTYHANGIKHYVNICWKRAKILKQQQQYTDETKKTHTENVENIGSL